MKVSINRIAAFLLAITHSTFAFALDCNAVRDSCWRTLRQDYEACSQKYTGQRQTDCRAGAGERARSCVKAGGCG